MIFFLTTLVWVRASNIVYDCIKEIDNLTISTDNVMIQIRPPGLVTLFLSLVGDVMLIQKGWKVDNTFANIEAMLEWKRYPVTDRGKV